MGSSHSGLFCEAGITPDISSSWNSLTSGMCACVPTPDRPDTIPVSSVRAWRGLDILAETVEGGVEALLAHTDALPGDARQSLIATLLPDKAKVALLVSNNNRIGIHTADKGTHLVATAQETSASETFEVRHAGNGRVALRSEAARGTWLVARPCDPSEAVTDQPPQTTEDHVPEWMTFAVYPLGDNRIALRGHHGWFVRAEYGGGGDVYCDGERIGPHEVLLIERLAAPESPSGMERQEQLLWRVKIGAHIHDLHC